MIPFPLSRAHGAQLARSFLIWLTIMPLLIIAITAVVSQTLPVGTFDPGYIAPPDLSGKPIMQGMHVTARG